MVKKTRLSFDVPKELKAEVAGESKARMESMIATLIRAWKVYKMVRDGELYRAHYKEQTRLGGTTEKIITHYTKLEII